MNSIIEIKNIGKKYNIAHQRGGYVALRDVLMGIIKSPFSFLKSKAKQVAGFEKKEEFWALKDINFSVQKGEIVGIIGSNGAGKSTLLKILSQITPPTEGEIILRGRVGSLLEVGTGFHPELTGRENIFLNGAILGMKKKEIAKKFDEIVEFAGIGKFLDTPVKYYSSGMYVRLAFSVAAHMEPDILLVDEVLAVGDAEFQKKCLGKMDEITKTQGRTILFVSHNMEAIRSICSKCIILKNGQIRAVGHPKDIIDEYLNSVQKNAIKTFDLQNPGKEARILKVAIKDHKGKYTTNISMNNHFFVEIEYELKDNISAWVVLKIFKASISNSYVLVTLSNDNNQPILKEKGIYCASVKIDPMLNVGNYSFLAGIATDTKRYLDSILEYNVISVSDGDGTPFSFIKNSRLDAMIVFPFEWKITKI